MCVRPIIINHPTKDFHLSDPIRLAVPCNHCQECLQKIRSEFRVRLVKQMEWNANNHFKNYFLTLTYNEGHLPQFHFSKELVMRVTPTFLEQCKTIPCFSRRDVRRFRLALQKWLTRQYGIARKLKDSDGYEFPPINFFIVCEFGGQFGRPHYHMFLGCHEIVPSDELFKKIQQLWQGDVALDDDCDSETFGLPVTLPDGTPRYTDGNGFVYPPELDGGYVNGKKQNPFEIKNWLASAMYNAKYICKDLSYYKFNDDLVRVLDGLRLDKKLDDLGVSCIAQMLLHSLRDSLPFYSISHNFGSCIIDELKADDVKTTVENIIKGIPIKQKNGLTKYEKVPFYILRKMLFDCRTFKDHNGDIRVRFDLNDLGTYYRISTYQDRINKMVTHFKSSLVLATFYHDDDVLRIKKQYLDKFSYEDWQLLAVYKMTFRYRLCPILANTELHLKGDEIYNFNIDSFDACMSVASLYEITDKQRLDGFQVTHKNFPVLSELTFNNFGVFKGYEQICSALDKFDLSLRSRSADQKQKDRDKLQTLSHMFNI